MKTALGLIAAIAALANAAHAQAPGPRAPVTHAPVPAVPAENCQLVLSETDINYGAMTRYGLEPSGGGTQDLALAQRRVTLNVSCRAPAAIGLRFRGPSAGADYLFGRQGKVVMHLSEPRLDGRTVLVGTATAAGMLPAAPASGARFMPGQVIVPVEAGKPATGSQFSAVVDITPSLSRDAARVRNRTPMETEGTFEVVWR